MATFEEQLKALEAVVEKLEKGELALGESVALFEKGMKLSAACKQELESAEGKIQILMKQEDGEFLAADLKVNEVEQEEEEG